MELSKYDPAFVRQYADGVIQETSRSTIGCIIPAYNEEETIGPVLESLLNQTRLPDEIHVVVNNTKDDTFYVAHEYAGTHTRQYRDDVMTTKVYVHDAGSVPDRKVGALNIGFKHVEHLDYLLGVDGDTILDRKTVASLVAEMDADQRIGGISAIYSVDTKDAHNPISGFLVAGQRQQFASFNRQNLLKGRNMSVLGGQCSLFNMNALKSVQNQFRQAGPWVSDSEVEDSLLSIQLKKLGYFTKISATARANVGGMMTLKSLDAQQVKWNYGAIDLLWPGQRNNIKGMPFHPNLRIRWWENWNMLLNMLVRLGFILLLLASVGIGAFTFSPWWLIPPVLAIALNVKIALTMHNRKASDVIFALLFLPAEIYLWVRMGHFVRAWVQFFSAKDQDNWTAQSNAESGKGKNVYLYPLFAALVILATIVVIWFTIPLAIQTTILYIAWHFQVIVTVLLCLSMLRQLLKRNKGFKF